MRRSSPRFVLPLATSIVVSTGCSGEAISEEGVFNVIRRIDDFLESQFISSLLSSLPQVTPYVLGVLGIGLLIFSRRTFFRLHSALLLGALFAALLGIAGAIIGGFGSYASIYAVNNYFERLIGSHGTIITILGGGLVGVMGMIAAIFITMIAFLVVGALLSALTGSSIDIPILDNWGSPIGSLRFWIPGDVGGSGEGSFGCGAALAPGFLVAPIVGAYAGIRLQNGDPLDISNFSWGIAAISGALVSFIAFLAGMRLGWQEGSELGALVGAFYGYLLVRTFGDDFGLHYPTFLRIITYIVGVGLFAFLGGHLVPKER